MLKLLKKIDETCDVARKEGLRPKSARTEENIELVEEMILSQEDKPGSPSRPAEITCELNIERPSVSYIIAQDLDCRPLRKHKVQKFTDSNNEKRTIGSRKLLSKYTQKTEIAFFSDKKIFKVKQLTQQCGLCYEENEENRGAKRKIILRN